MMYRVGGFLVRGFLVGGFLVGGFLVGRLEGFWFEGEEEDFRPKSSGFSRYRNLDLKRGKQG